VLGTVAVGRLASDTHSRGFANSITNTMGAFVQFSFSSATRRMFCCADAPRSERVSMNVNSGSQHFMVNCRFTIAAILNPVFAFVLVSGFAGADEPVKSTGKYAEQFLRPVWLGDTVEGESALFIKDVETGRANASVLFPVQKVISIRNSAGDVTYEEGRDYHWKPGSAEITLPADSRIVSFAAAELRRPAGSQRHKLTHRDGDGEILFGATSEYHRMQTCITYTHAAEDWTSKAPKFDEKALPRTIAKLRQHQPVSIVLLGDSISTGCNASGWAGEAPFQPPFQDLLTQHLKATYQTKVELVNPSVGGQDTRWALTMVDTVLRYEPDLVILAFGMNDSAGRSAEEYKSNTLAVMAKIRKQRPETEFILLATMLGNRNWITLKHELFPLYRNALAELCEPGIALADMTSLWSEFFERKQDWDLTGNGVNHPNDFGHRVYAQVLSTLLVDPKVSGFVSVDRSEPQLLQLWNGSSPIGGGAFEKADTKITIHQAPNPNGAAIVICPGGGYGGLVTGAEGHGIASWLNRHGITGVVLEYRLPAGRPFVPLLDAQRAIRTVRANAKQWEIDPSKIGIMGFSAGGHLASTAATHFDDGDAASDDVIERSSCRPDFAILVYPVVTMDDSTHHGSRTNLLGENPSPELIQLFSNQKQVTDKTPPMFMAHALDDKPVPPENSRSLFAALQSAGVPSKYLELPSGGHGLNGYQGPMWDAWQKQCLEWLEELNFVPAKQQ